MLDTIVNEESNTIREHAIGQHQERLEQQQRQQKQAAPTNDLESIHAYRQFLGSNSGAAPRQLHDVKAQIDIKVRNLKRRAAKLQNLKNDDVYSSAKAATLVHTNCLRRSKRHRHELFSIDADRCLCGRLFMFESITTTNRCMECARVHQVLSASSDTTTDIIVFRAQTKPQINTVPAVNVLDAEQNAAKHQLEKGVAGEDLELDRIEAANQRSESIENFLLQFSQAAVVFDEDVIDKVYFYASSHTILTPTRFKSTPIALYLKDQKDIAISKQANAVVMRMTATLPPTISLELITQIAARANVYNLASLQMDVKPTPADITVHIMLLLEGEDELATYFHLHKTRAVIVKADTRLRIVLERCRALDADKEWKDVRLV